MSLLGAVAQAQAQHCSVAGWACTSAGDLCAERKMHAKSGMWPSATSACAANGARVCTRGDLLAMCSIKGFNPFGGVEAGWFGDRVPAPSGTGQRWFHAWNENDYCTSHGHTGFAAQLLPGSTELPYRCCRAAPLGGRQLAKLAPARACPSGWRAGKSSTCMTLKPHAPTTYASATQTCRSQQARVCTMGDVLTACGSADAEKPFGETNPFYGMSDPHETWWMGTPRAEGGVVTWRGDNCDEVFASQQGQPKPASSKFAFKCCKGTQQPAVKPKAPPGWACTASGDICAQKQLNKAGGMDWAGVKVCGRLQAHVCTHSDTVALCGANVNPFQGTKRGWLGDVARASKQKFKFGSFFTWTGNACGLNTNIGAAAPSTTSLGFRCCRGVRKCGSSGGGGNAGNSGGGTTRPTCKNDPHGVLARMGVDCTTGMKQIKGNCDYDMSRGGTSSLFAEGTRARQVCPLACGGCGH